MAAKHSAHGYNRERRRPSDYDQYSQDVYSGSAGIGQGQGVDQGQYQSGLQDRSASQGQRRSGGQGKHSGQVRGQAQLGGQVRGQGQVGGQGQDQYRRGGQNQGQYWGDDQGQFQQYGRVNYSFNQKRSHTGRNIAVVILVLVLVIGGFGGFTGWTLYNSAKHVRSEASQVMTELSDLKNQVVSGSPEQAAATARSISDHASDMVDETSGWAWSVASVVPVYGSDVGKVRELSAVLVDMTDNAVVPLVDQLSQMSLSNLLHDGAVDVGLAQQLVSAVDSAAPVIQRNAKILDDMEPAHFDQINGPLQKARTMMDDLSAACKFASDIAPAFSDMLGANGQRTYLIVAQTCAEIRSTGGFLGSLGPLYIDNGNITLGDFRAVKTIYPSYDHGGYAPLTDEEINIFGVHVGRQIPDASFIPDWSRVSEIVKFAWEDHGLGQVNGVIGVDPVFLQSMLGLVGSITTSTGITVDGSNTAQLLLRDVYYLPTNEEQDVVFEDVASLAFDKLMSSLGEVSITKLADTVGEGFSSRHVQIWMNESVAEDAITTFGADGKLSHDAANPTLGVYFSEESYSKLYWYFKAETAVGEGVKNADGTTTYPVTVTYRNMIQPGQEGDIPPYALSHNGMRRNDAEMITWVYLSAPEGGYISDMTTEGDFMPPEKMWRDDGAYFSGDMMESTLQGLNFWYGLTRTLPGSSFTVSFNVTTSPHATAPLKVVRTPNAQEVAGW